MSISNGNSNYLLLLIRPLLRVLHHIDDYRLAENFIGPWVPTTGRRLKETRSSTFSVPGLTFRPLHSGVGVGTGGCQPYPVVGDFHRPKTLHCRGLG